MLIRPQDSAFLDRVDIKQAVLNPSTKAAYEIFRSTYDELLKRGILIPRQKAEPVDQTDYDSDGTELGTPASEISTELFPSADKVVLDLWDQPHVPAARLWTIAEASTGFSGRSLRRLPILALGLYTHGDPQTVHQALRSLALAVAEQKRSGVRDNKHQSMSIL